MNRRGVRFVLELLGIVALTAFFKRASAALTASVKLKLVQREELSAVAAVGRRGGLLTRARRSMVGGSLAVVTTGVMAVLFGPQIAAFAGVGTAVPPRPLQPAPFNTVNLPTPKFSVDPVDIHGFDIIGFVQQTSVSGAACPGTDAHNFGGTLRINNTDITIPCNLVIQMPANTFTWADFISSGPPINLGTGHPSFEVQVQGNIVGGKYIAALAFLSQNLVNSHSGILKKIDYATGNLEVSTSDPTVNTIVQINDPLGRYGRKQSPDLRFSVDDQNPTIKSKTGYPMCVPRADPGTAVDDLCPQTNRPVASAGHPCRNFAAASVPLPASGELAAAAAGAFCKTFVLPPINAIPAPVAGFNTLPVAARTGSEPDARQQVPFEVGDFLIYSGTLFNAGVPSTQDSAPNTGLGGVGSSPKGEYISAHTISGQDVGPFTQPGTKPGYIALDAFGIGTADPATIAVNGAAQTIPDRINLETQTTDIKTPVDIYLPDVSPNDGSLRNRWVSPFELTGENPNGVPSGGMTTQNAGPRPERSRVRTALAPPGLLNQPPRDIRVAQRSLCTPNNPIGQPDRLGQPGTAQQTPVDACFAAVPRVANGLLAGEYTAPNFAFIFPENLKPGEPIIPINLWNLPFLVGGEGADNPFGPAVGPLKPTPW